MRRYMQEFKEFAVKGNVIDLAVGVIIGTAFSKITSSLVNDIAMPIINIFTGGINLSSWVVKIPKIFTKDSVSFLNIGNFIQTVLEFIILAYVTFVFVKLLNRAKRKQNDNEKRDEIQSREEVLLKDIRDILRDK